MTLIDTLSLNTIADDYIYTSLRCAGNYLYAHSINKSGVAHPHGIVSIYITDVKAMVISDTYTISSSISSTAFHNNTMEIAGQNLFFVDQGIFY